MRADTPINSHRETIEVPMWMCLGLMAFDVAVVACLAYSVGPITRLWHDASGTFAITAASVGIALGIVSFIVLLFHVIFRSSR